MHIAILGATSEIAKDLIASFSDRQEHDLVLYSRNSAAVRHWLASLSLAHRCKASEYSTLNEIQDFDAIVNFVGVGNPAKAAQMGASIIDITLQYDELALAYLQRHPDCRYLFLSSGAAFGSTFSLPADDTTQSCFPINQLQAQHWYGLAKFYAECRHRVASDLSIVDIRVFNYFSRHQSMDAGYFITDIVQALRHSTNLSTTASRMQRDYLGADDFHQLVECILHAPPGNIAMDCYSRAPISKLEILELMERNFGLRYQIDSGANIANGTGTKLNYYSVSRRAADFGYKPRFSSADTLLSETTALLLAQ